MPTFFRSKIKPPCYQTKDSIDKRLHEFPTICKEKSCYMHQYLKERQYLPLLHKYWVLVWNDDVWRNAKKWEQTNANLKYVLHCCIPYAYFQLLMPIDSVHNKICLACLRQDYMNITASLNWSIFSHVSSLHFTGSCKYLYPKRHSTSSRSHPSWVSEIFSMVKGSGRSCRRQGQCFETLGISILSKFVLSKLKSLVKSAQILKFLKIWTLRISMASVSLKWHRD